MSRPPVRTGDFKRRVTIQKRATTRDTFGQESTAWVDFIRCWADIQPMSGNELMAAQAVQSAITHKVTIYYRPTVTAAMRVIYLGRVLGIQSIIDPDMAHVVLEMMCGEGLNLG